MTRIQRSVVCLFALLLTVSILASPQKRPGPEGADTMVSISDEKSEITLKRPEQIAAMFVITLMDLESDCVRHAGHACTVEEMLAGAKPTDDWKIAKLKWDPAKWHPDYDYKVTVAGKNWEIWASPRKPGMAGFYAVYDGSFPKKYFNPAGPATAKDRKLIGMSMGGDSFTTD